MTKDIYILKNPPPGLKLIAKIMINGCPICGKTIFDGRYKDWMTAKEISPVIIRRISRLTLTKQCMKCGLRFSLRWSSLARALRKIVEYEKKQGNDEKDYEGLIVASENLEKFFGLKKNKP